MTSGQKKLAIFKGQGINVEFALGNFLAKDPTWRIAIPRHHVGSYMFPSPKDETQQEDTIKMLQDAQVRASLNACLYTAVPSKDEDETLHWRDVANEASAEVEIYTVTENGGYHLDEQDKFVPMGEAYVPDESLPKAVWLDVDGTAFTMFDKNGGDDRRGRAWVETGVQGR